MINLLCSSHLLWGLRKYSLNEFDSWHVALIAIKWIVFFSFTTHFYGNRPINSYSVPGIKPIATISLSVWIFLYKYSQWHTIKINVYVFTKLKIVDLILLYRVKKISYFFKQDLIQLVDKVKRWKQIVEDHVTGTLTQMNPHHSCLSPIFVNYSQSLTRCKGIRQGSDL